MKPGTSGHQQAHHELVVLLKEEGVTRLLLVDVRAQHSQGEFVEARVCSWPAEGSRVDVPGAEPAPRP